MPRPKRSKVAPSAPTAILPNSKTATLSAVPSRISSPDPSQKSTNSDDSIGLVKRNASGKNRRGIAKEDARMSGALPVSEDDVPVRSRAVSRQQADGARDAKETKGLNKFAKTRRGGYETGPEGGQDVQVPSSMPDSDKSSVSENKSRQPPAPSTAEKPQSRAAMNWRAQATPRGDSSMISLANFKRRPRQPSILGIGRQADSSTLDSLGGDSGLSLGLGHESDVDSMFEFGANAKSPGGAPAERRIVVENSFDHDPDVESPEAEYSSVIGTKKRKVTPPEVQVPQSQALPDPESRSASEVNEGSGLRLGSELPAGEFDDEPSLPPPRRRVATPDIFSETMAPPQSSSPTRSQEHAAAKPSPVFNLAASTRTKSTRNQATRATSAQNSKAESKKQASRPLTTASLQALLPRRRITKHHGEFDIRSDSSGPSVADMNENDDDELSFAAPSRRKTTSKSKRPTMLATKTPARKPRSRAPGTAAAAAAANKLKTTPASGKSSSKPKRTYTRRLSDKENQSAFAAAGGGGDEDEINDSLLPSSVDDSSATSVALPKKAQKELKLLAKKFEEVDEWEMEFEEVTGSSELMRDAR